MNRGRNQLLQWINQLLQTQYTSIQMLGDCIAYCQILQLIHPNSINMTRLNLNTRYPDDCVRNSKVLQDGLKRVKITQPANMQKVGKGKFQDNIIFVQWLYGYANKGVNYQKMMQNFSQSQSSYSGYNKRISILEKQGKQHQELNSHLIPNQIYIQEIQRLSGRGRQYDYDGYDNYDKEKNINKRNNQRHIQQQKQKYYKDNKDKQQQYILSQYQKKTIKPDQYPQQQQQQQYYLQSPQQTKIKQLNQYIINLQNDLRQKMQINWRTMHLMDKSIEQRNILFNLLQEIQIIANKFNKQEKIINNQEYHEKYDKRKNYSSQQSYLVNQILKILYEIPQQFNSKI